MTDTRQVLEEAYETIFGKPAIWHEHWGIFKDSVRGGQYLQFLDAEAWTDAALMLVPPDCQCVVTIFDDGEGEVILTDNDGRDIERTAAIPALAIAQAALRAKEAGDA